MSELDFDKSEDSGNEINEPTTAVADNNNSSVVVSPEVSDENDEELSEEEKAELPIRFEDSGDILDKDGVIVGDYWFDTVGFSFAWESMIKIHRTDGFEVKHPAYRGGEIYQLFGYNVADNRIDKAMEMREHIKQMLAENNPIEDIERYIEDTGAVIRSELRMHQG